MSQHLTGKTLFEADAVLKEGRILWSAYFDHIDSHAVRAEWRLERPDDGWYQLRNVLKLRNAWGDCTPKYKASRPYSVELLYRPECSITLVTWLVRALAQVPRFHSAVWREPHACALSRRSNSA